MSLLCSSTCGAFAPLVNLTVIQLLSGLVPELEHAQQGVVPELESVTETELECVTVTELVSVSVRQVHVTVEDRGCPQQAVPSPAHPSSR